MSRLPSPAAMRSASRLPSPRVAAGGGVWARCGSPRSGAFPWGASPGGRTWVKADLARMERLSLGGRVPPWHAGETDARGPWRRGRVAGRPQGGWGRPASQASWDRPRVCGGGTPRLFPWWPGCVSALPLPGQRPAPLPRGPRCVCVPPPPRRRRPSPAPTPRTPPRPLPRLGPSRPPPREGVAPPAASAGGVPGWSAHGS